MAGRVGNYNSKKEKKKTIVKTKEISAPQGGGKGSPKKRSHTAEKQYTLWCGGEEFNG